MSSSIIKGTAGDVTVTDKIRMNLGRPIIKGALAFPLMNRAVLTSGATVTYTAAQVLGGMIIDTITANCAATLPTPASIVAGVPGAIVGTSFEIDILNTAASAIVITVTANGASTVVGTATINQANNKRIRAVITNVGLGTEAVVFYMLGSSST